MRLPMMLTFRHIERSPTLEAQAHELGSRLEQLGQRITECRMTLEGPADGTRRSTPYQVTIDLALPNARIHAESLHHDSTGHDGIYPAMRDAFNNAKRQLMELH
jgi:hypothetical protein